MKLALFSPPPIYRPAVAPRHVRFGQDRNEKFQLPEPTFNCADPQEGYCGCQRGSWCFLCTKGQNDFKNQPLWLEKMARNWLRFHRGASFKSTPKEIK